MQADSNTPENLKSKANLDTMVTDKLRQGILSGEMPSGTHLSELKLSKDYGVSRTPVREALCALAADGLIEMIPNRGAFVTSPSYETIQENRILFGHLKALAARQAQGKISETGMARLEKLIADMAQPGTQLEDARQAFHLELETTAEMPALMDMLTYLGRRLPQPALPPVSLNNEASMVKQGYQYFLAALKSRKPDVAEKAMRDIMALNFSVTFQGENNKNIVA